MSSSLIFDLGERRVQTLSDDYFVAPNATLIGSVTLGHQVSIWFNAVLRGDNDEIIIGDRSNVQDGAILHTDPGLRLAIGEDVTVGHKAMLHGCSVGNGSLIGINAVILNEAQIGANCLIGANTLIPEGKVIPEGSLVLGSPGKVVRQLTDPERTKLVASATHYVENYQRYLSALQPRL